MTNPVKTIAFCNFVPLAFIISMFAQHRCNYISVNEDLSNTGDGGVSHLIGNAGVFCWQDRSGDNWSYSNGANALEEVRAAQNLSLATTVMGATAWALFIFAGCVKYPPVVWLFVSGIIAATAVTEGLVYREMFNSAGCTESGACSLGTGAKCAISAMTFWTISAFSCLCVTMGLFKEAADGNNSEELYSQLIF